MSETCQHCRDGGKESERGRDGGKATEERGVKGKQMEVKKKRGKGEGKKSGLKVNLKNEKQDRGWKLWRKKRKQKNDMDG
ncbi:uncharacterized [Tachysurus ichikawai]